MQKRTKTLLGSTTLAGLAALAPLSLDLGAPARGESPVRLNQACGQTADDCIVKPNYVCFTKYGYLTNYIAKNGTGS